jgi:membrane protein YqaA with SNARE-associated domain
MQANQRSSQGQMPVSILLGLAFVWAFLEATVFFVVPDVIISIICIVYGWREGAKAVGFAILGAILGGITTYFWGKANIDAARAFFDLLPAIGPENLARAKATFEGHELGLDMLMGSLTSVPFKLYASEAGAANSSLLQFVLLTPFVRLPRFAFAALLSGMAHAYAPNFIQTNRAALIIVFWVGFYALYWGTAA